MADENNVQATNEVANTQTGDMPIAEVKVYTIEELQAMTIDQIQQLDQTFQSLVFAEVQKIKQVTTDKVKEAEQKAIDEARTIMVEAKAVEVGASSFWQKYHMAVIVAALLIISHVAARFGY